MCKLHVSTLKIYPFELNSNRLVAWHIINYVVGKNNDGQNKKVLKVEYCETKLNMLLKYIKSIFQEFFIQKFIAKHLARKKVQGLCTKSTT